MSNIPSGEGVMEGLRDHGSFSYRGGDETDMESHHRAMNAMYIGLHLPKPDKPSKKRRRHKKTKKESNIPEEPQRPSTPPSQRVKFILGQNEDDDDTHEPHDIFCEMEELQCVGEDGDLEWKETARWIKFEEDVEEGGNRWSKPHVATLSLHSLFELRKGLMTGTVKLDMEAFSLIDIADMVLDNMVNTKQIAEDNRDKVRDVLLRRHRHQHQMESKGSGIPFVRSLADIGKKHSEPRFSNGKGGNLLSTAATAPGGLKMSHSSGTLTSPKSGSNISDTSFNPTDSASDLPYNNSSHKINQHFMKKIPKGAEASNILVGEVEFLDMPIIAFVRLKQAVLLGDLTEVPVPTRFLFILLGPQGNSTRYHEIGRSIATLMSDEVFHDVAYKAKNRQDLLSGIDEFLDQVTVLPPGEWDPSIRIEPPKSVPSQEKRKTGTNGPTPPPMPNGTAAVSEEEEHGDPTLVRTGRLFGGLIGDLKRKVPFYPSDIKDSLSIQCVASFVFLYFACLTPIITFGGLLGDATKNQMAAIESIVGGAICGTTYHLFSGQPLTIIGSTGPVLVFETILFHFCEDNGLDYLSFRFWIGIWTGIILVFMVAFDLSALVRYITRFTEESFAALIAFIFIFEAFKKLISITKSNPVHTSVLAYPIDHTCNCYPLIRNETAVNETVPTVAYTMVNATNATPIDWGYVNRADCIRLGGFLDGPGCNVKYNPDVFFFSVLLFLGTYALAVTLKAFRNSRFFPTKVRTLVSDFAVLIAIMIMIGIDIGIGIPTPKLQVPLVFQPTIAGRGWIVNPFKNPWWVIPAAILPALLATILIFMDQQITAVIVNRKENKLKKGGGYHLDLFVIAIQIILMSIMGLPWYVAATVLSINHVMSLKKESECTAPGERPKFLGVREQRVTGTLVFLMIGMSVLMTKILRAVPLPVLYGVFLFMGTSSLRGVQFMQRLMICITPQKYQPDYIFLRHVPTRRVHLFTAIQGLCLICLWVIKTIKSISIVFPLMVLAMCFVRKAMDYIFTQHELKWLDDIMPESHKRAKEDEKKKVEEGVAGTPSEGGGAAVPAIGEKVDNQLSSPEGQSVVELEGGTIAIPLKGHKQINIPVDKIVYNPATGQVNISEEMAKTAVWKQLAANESNPDIQAYGVRSRHKRKSRDRGNGSSSSPPTDDRKGSLKMPVRFRISEEELENLISEDKKKEEEKKEDEGAPQIVIDPPSLHGSNQGSLNQEAGTAEDKV